MTTPAPPAPQVRIAVPADAPALLRLRQRLDLETEFMLLQPDERDPSPEPLAEHLTASARSANSVAMVAVQGDSELAGFVELIGGAYRRNRFNAHLIIGVQSAAGGQGLGTTLLREALAWATSHGLHRIDLNVMTHNHRAIRLYERHGFATEGRRSECLFLHGEYRDEFIMALLLPGQAGK